MIEHTSGSQPVPDKNPFIRMSLLIAGSFSALLGIAGIFIPLLPTTPFLLLASWCFARSSDKLNRKLMTNRYFGPYISNYRERRGITLRNKIYSLIFLWATLLSSLIVSPAWWWLWLLLTAVGVGVSYHVISFKTLKVLKK